MKWGTLAGKLLEERKRKQEGLNPSFFRLARLGIVDQERLQASERKKRLLVELRKCSQSRDLQRGKALHGEATKNGDDADEFVAAALINMYGKCRSVQDGQRVFDAMENRDVVAWTSLILGYADNGQGRKALNLFAEMQPCCSPNGRSFVAALKACGVLAEKESRHAAMETGDHIFAIALRSGFGADIYVQDTLLNLRTKCGDMEASQRLFDGMKQPSLVSWNTLIAGHAANGDSSKALRMISDMRLEGIALDSRTYIAAFKACSDLEGEIEGRRLGMKLHQLALRSGCASHVFVQSTLVDMYVKLGDMSSAVAMFGRMQHLDVASWNILILGYANNGEGFKALSAFWEMQRSGCAADARSFVAAFRACAFENLQATGMELHSLVMQSGCGSNLFVGNALICMYAKFGDLDEAQRIFDRMPQHDTVSWNALMLGYADKGEGAATFVLLQRMRVAGYIPDAATYNAVLKACVMVGAVEFGRCIHSEICRRGIQVDVVLATCLVDFYAKCGCLTEAEQVFSGNLKDVVTWCALMTGYSHHGNAQRVFNLFDGLLDAGLCPDGVAFKCLLTACSHAGLVSKGKECFASMRAKYGVEPVYEHYNCMLDVLSRGSNLDEAMTFLRSMPFQPGAVTWMTVLGACRKWKNAELGQLAFEALLSLDDLEDRGAAAFSVMASIYGSRGMWEDQASLQALRGKLGVWKRPGQSCWTDHLGMVHTFDSYAD